MKNELSLKQLQELWHQRRLLIWTGALVLGMVVLVMALIIPQVKTALDLRSKLASEEAKLATLQAKARELDDLLISPEYEMRDLVEQALPSRKPLLELLASLNAAVVGSGTKVSSLELSPGLIATDSAQVNRGRDKDVLAVDISVSGRFDQVEDLMKRIEEFSPFTTIASFSLSENQDSLRNSSSLVSATITTNSHYFTDSVTTTLEKPLPKLTDDDRVILTELEKFQPSNLVVPSRVSGGGLEDLFGVEGYDSQLKLLYQSLNK